MTGKPGSERTTNTLYMCVCSFVRPTVCRSPMFAVFVRVCSPMFGHFSNLE